MSELVAMGRHAFINSLARELSHTWLADLTRIQRAMRRLLTRQPSWSQRLCLAVFERFGPAGYATFRELCRWLAKSRELRKVFRDGRKLRIPRSYVDRGARHRWAVPEISDEAQLQDFLCLKSPMLLDWLIRPHVRRRTSVDHYSRRFMPKRDGGARVIEQPRPLLHRVQSTICKHLLSEVPLHDAAHGFVRERSVFSAASVHCGKRLVLSMDLTDFFGSIDRRRTTAVFRTAGYPPKVAYLLGCICTAPGANSEDVAEASIPQKSRLPQGAPTSPAISNAVAYRLDQRLAGLARSVQADYTRYADDLTFSGDAEFAKSVERFIHLVGAIAMHEGFEINYRKTRRMYSGRRQTVLGLVVNESPAASRRSYEELKAVLNNSVRHGPESQNRASVLDFQAHLRGRIEFVGALRPNRKKKLLESFRKIKWS